ncbi:MAG: LPS-assembly protein LptD [Kiritimatiellia bacterium]
MWSGVVHGQPVPFGNLASPSNRNPAVPIEVDAESMHYDRENGQIKADGNVVIVSGNDRLRADHVVVNVRTGDVDARGNVELERNGEIIRAEKLDYNTNTRETNLDAPRMESDPFHIVGENVNRSADNTITLQRAKVTTCMYDHDHAHYHVRARKLEVYPGDQLRARHAVWYLGRVPVFYVPHWRRRLHDDYGWNFYPGYRSRWGAFLLSSFFHRISPNLRLEHHVDQYTSRGVGLGETVDWRFEGGQGQLALYYIRDREPLGKNPPLDPPDIDADRYRIFMRHDQQFNPYTRLLLRNEYVSDIAVRRDFFDREYRRLRQPENFASLSYQEDLYTITALANYRLNGVFGNVNRLPEVSLNWYRMQLGDTSLYYESQSAAAFLQRVYPRDSLQEDYSTFRVDTLHSLYQPRRLAGWLHVVPRASYRGTYFSNSRDVTTQDIVSTRTVTNEITEVVETLSETNRITQVTDGSAQLRHVVEIGSEISFKAFKRLADSPGGQPWRHVVEPYLNYTLRLEPNVKPDALYQYDRIDRIDKAHQARIGVRNLLQTKWNGRSVEAVDLNLFTTANLDPEKDENTFETVTMQARFRPAQWMQIDTDGVYHLQESEVRTFNSRLSMSQDDSWRVGLEHRFRKDASNLVMFDTTFAPNREWHINVFSRYEFESSRLEEQGGYLQRNYDCMSVRLGGSVLPGFSRTDGTRAEDDYRILLAFWLTAFPEMGVRAGGR